jgi:hypothetical protein
MSDNLIVGSYYCAVNQIDGWMADADRYCHGYFGNSAVENEGNPFDDVMPQILTEDPFVNGFQTYPFFIRQNCPLIDAGAMTVEQAPYLIAKSTSSDGSPDINVADIGFHYINWNYSNAGSSTLTADFDNSYMVDFNDLSEFADYWLYGYNDNYNCWSWDLDDSGSIDFADLDTLAYYWPTSFDFVDFADFAGYWRREVDYRFQDRRFDLNSDGLVDFRDYVMFAEQWKQTTDNPNPPIFVAIYGEPNNLTGMIDFGISGRSSKITKGFIYIDGELKGYTRYSDDSEMASESSSIDTQELGNGQHSIKAVTIDSNGLITLSQTISVNTNNAVYNITKAKDFNQGEDYHIYAMSDSTSNLRVRVLAWDGTDVWTSSVSSGGLNVVVPASILTGPIYNIVIEMEGGALLGALSLPFYDIQREIGKYDYPTWEKIWGGIVSKIFPINDHYKVAIFLPNGLFKYTQTPTADCRIRAVAELTYWCTLKNMKYIILYKGNCTWQNFVTVLSKPSVSYVYMVAHGSNLAEPSDPNSVHRLFFVVSGPSGDINDTERVYSRKGGLPGDLDTNPSAHSMEKLGLGQSTQIRCVYMTVCYQGESDEMAKQWIKWDPTPLDQLFCGWKGCAEGYNTDWQDWDYQFWCQWGSGGVLASDVINALSKAYLYIWWHFAPIGWDQMLFTTQGNY